MQVPNFQHLLAQVLKGEKIALDLWNQYHQLDLFSKEELTATRKKIDFALQTNAHDSHALTLRGYMYHVGQDEQQDIEKAMSFYKEAVALKNITAMSNLGTIYHYSEGSRQNYAAAIAIYDEAILLGDATAMNYPVQIIVEHANFITSLIVSTKILMP